MAQERYKLVTANDAGHGQSHKQSEITEMRPADPTEVLNEPHLISASRSFSTKIILTAYPYNSSRLSQLLQI